jgi:hypothetical protein
LPKTRSGKIMRRLLRDVADHWPPVHRIVLQAVVTGSKQPAARARANDGARLAQIYRSVRRSLHRVCCPVPERGPAAFGTPTWRSST